jgi:hypothetical protein
MAPARGSIRMDLLERYLICQHKAYGALGFEFVAKHDPELVQHLKSIADRIMRPTVDLEAKRLARLQDTPQGES